MKKIKIFLISIFFVVFFSGYYVVALVDDYSLLGKIIYLDAGHGGVDSGAFYNMVYEKDINLEIVKKIEKELIKNGAVVYLTRDGDYDLSTTTSGRKRSDLTNRANLINNSDCDIYLSIHLNASNDSRWRGLQVFYNENNDANIIFAKSLNKVFKESISNVRDIKTDNSYYMYNNINKTGLLIEVGFLSNPSENYLLRSSDYQDNIASLVTKGIINYFA